MNPRIRGVLAALLIACTGLLVAGCGGDDKLSKSDFIAKADAACKKGNDAVAKVKQPSAVGDVERYVKEAKPLVQKEIDELKDLKDKAPDDVKDDFSKALGLLEKQLGLFDDLAAAAKANDQAKFQEVSAEGSKINDEANALAKKIGLKVCGQN